MSVGQGPWRAAVVLNAAYCLAQAHDQTPPSSYNCGVFSTLHVGELPLWLVDCCTAAIGLLAAAMAHSASCDDSIVERSYTTTE